VRRPRLRTILLIVNLVLIGLPLTGIWTLRLYESALLRQTESELIAQGAMVAAAFRAAWLAAAGEGALQAMPVLATSFTAPPPDQPLWQPRPAVLDLAEDPVLPPPPSGLPPMEMPEPAAVAAGEALQPVLREAQLTTLAGIRILDVSGIVVATTREDYGLSLRAWDEVKAALGGEWASRLRVRPPEGPDPPLTSISRSSALRVFVGVPVIEQGRMLGAVVLSRTPRSIVQALYGKRYHLAGLAALLVGSVVLLALFSAFTISRPLRAVMLQARRVAGGERSAVVPVRRPGTREVEDLSASIVTMAQTLEQRADYIAAFAAEVSHEFKTPLTAIRGTVEVLRDHLDDMSAEERERFLTNIEQDVGRLDRLVRRLLELARADMLRPAPDENARLDEIASAIVEDYRRAGLRVAVEPGSGPVTVAMSGELLRSVIRNLLDNIRQHAGPGASARLSWRVEDGRAALHVADDGVGISPGNAARVFDRFFTTARDAGGTGLGLAIIRSQLAAHGGTIALVPSTRGAAFVIRLPLSVESGQGAQRL
jgi:signal transduction histidine kinase